MTTATKTNAIPMTSLIAIDPVYAALTAVRDETHDWPSYRRNIAAIVPVVGMGATYNGYSDRKACTIVAVSKSGKQMTVRYDSAELLNGATSGKPDALMVHEGGFAANVTGKQRYTYTANESGATVRFSRRLVGDFVAWVQVGTPTKSGPTCTAGIRAHHYDYNF